MRRFKIFSLKNFDKSRQKQYTVSVLIKYSQWQMSNDQKTRFQESHSIKLSAI